MNIESYMHYEILMCVCYPEARQESPSSSDAEQN
jgi:hypothetical protein